VLLTNSCRTAEQIGSDDVDVAAEKRHDMCPGGADGEAVQQHDDQPVALTGLQVVDVLAMDADLPLRYVYRLTAGGAGPTPDPPAWSRAGHADALAWSRARRFVVGQRTS